MKDKFIEEIDLYKSLCEKHIISIEELYNNYAKLSSCLALNYEFEFINTNDYNYVYGYLTRAIMNSHNI